MIYKIKADTQLKQGILDPEGNTIKTTLVQMGYPVTKFATSKSMLVDVEADDAAKAVELVEDMCAKILANPVLHDYSVEVITEETSLPRCREICVDPDLMMVVNNGMDKDTKATLNRQRLEWKKILECPMQKKYTCNYHVPDEFK